MKTKISPSLMALHLLALCSTAQLLETPALAEGRNLTDAELNWDTGLLRRRLAHQVNQHQQAGNINVGNANFWSASGRFQEGKDMWLSFGVSVSRAIPAPGNQGPENDVPASRYVVKCVVSQSTPAGHGLSRDAALDFGQCVIRDREDNNNIVPAAIRDRLLSILDIPNRRHLNVADLGQFAPHVAGTVIDTSLPSQQAIASRTQPVAPQRAPGRTLAAADQAARDSHDPESAGTFADEGSGYVRQNSAGAD